MTDKERFNKALEKVLQNEGGYANVSGDKGGETYKGIARNYHPDWPGWKIVDQVKPLSWNETIDNDTLDFLVRAFYYEKFWRRYQLEKIDNFALQKIIFDFFKFKKSKNFFKINFIFFKSILDESLITFINFKTFTSFNKYFLLKVLSLYS